MAENDRPHVLREMIYVCRPAGVISIIGVYGGLVDKIPWGMAMNKGLTFRMAQGHVPLDRRPAPPDRGRADRSHLRHHPQGAAHEGPEMYTTFRDKQDSCIKVMLQPA